MLGRVTHWFRPVTNVHYALIPRFQKTHIKFDDNGDPLYPNESVVLPKVKLFLDLARNDRERLSADGG